MIRVSRYYVDDFTEDYVMPLAGISSPVKRIIRHKSLKGKGLSHTKCYFHHPAPDLRKLMQCLSEFGLENFWVDPKAFAIEWDRWLTDEEEEIVFKAAELASNP